MGIEAAKFVRQYEYDNLINKTFIVGLTTPEDEEENFYGGFDLFVKKEGLTVQGLLKDIVQTIEQNQKENEEFKPL